MRRKNKRAPRNRKKILAIALVAVLLVATGLFTYMYVAANRSSVAEETPSDTTAKTVTTEGREIEIPDDVDEDMIVDYELVAETEHYKIRRHGDNYMVTLYAIINNPNQRDWYLEQLKEYKAAALTEMQEQGINTNEVNITYEPEEAAEL